MSFSFSSSSHYLLPPCLPSPPATERRGDPPSPRAAVLHSARAAVLQTHLREIGRARADPPRASSFRREELRRPRAPSAARELSPGASSPAGEELRRARAPPPAGVSSATAAGGQAGGGRRPEEARSDGHGGERPEGAPAVHEGGGGASGAVRRESGRDGDPLRSGNKASRRGGLATWIARSEFWRLCWISFLAQLCYL